MKNKESQHHVAITVFVELEQMPKDNETWGAKAKEESDILDLVKKQMQKELSHEEVIEMLWTIITVLGILWLLGMVTSYTAGGMIHILLVLAVIMFLFNMFSGRRSA